MRRLGLLFLLHFLAASVLALQPSIRGFQAAKKVGQPPPHAPEVVQQPAASCVELRQQQQQQQPPPQQHQQTAPPQKGGGAALHPPPLHESRGDCSLTAGEWGLAAAAAAGFFACGVAVGTALRHPAVPVGPQQQAAAEPAGPVAAEAAEASEAARAGKDAAPAANSTAAPLQPELPRALSAGRGSGGLGPCSACSPASSSEAEGSLGGEGGAGPAAPGAQEGPAGASGSQEAVEDGAEQQQAQHEQLPQHEQPGEPGGQPLQRSSGGAAARCPASASPRAATEVVAEAVSAAPLETSVASIAGLTAGHSFDWGATAAGAIAAGPIAGSGSQLGEEDQRDVMAAGALVSELTRALRIDLAALGPGERLQLLHMVLQAWQAQQAKRHGEAMARLGLEANALRGQQRDIAAQRAALQFAGAAHALGRERAAEFRRAASDTLAFGLAVMLAVAAYRAARGGGVAGALAGLFAQCGRWGGPAAGAWGPWGVVWHGWSSLRVAGCYLLTAGDAALGLGVLLAAPWGVYRSGILSGGGGGGTEVGLPFTRLLAGLGLCCGAAGWVAVGRVGGDRVLWLAAWELWVAVQVTFAAAAHRLLRVTARVAAGEGVVAGEDMYQRSSSWLYALMWALVGVLLPTAAGWLPFRAS